MQRVLVANRGEIACRIIRTLDRMGIESVAVFTDVDRASLHCDLATIAVPIGPATGAGYRDVDALLAVAKAHDVDGVHPGYGFLAENADAAAAFEAAGLVFIGPDARADPALRRQGRSAHRGRGRRRAAPGRAPRRSSTSTPRWPPRRRSASRSWSRASPAGAGSGCWRAPTRPSSRRPSNGRCSRARPRSATRRCSSSGWSPTPATSRCRCSATAPAPWSRSASATARRNAAGRRCWRRRPRPASTPRRAPRSPTPPAPCSNRSATARRAPSSSCSTSTPASSTSSR